jgi:hypothetical protein
MKKTAIHLAIAALSLAAAPAFASGLGSLDVGVTAGTLGYGPQVGMTIVPNKFDARLNFGYLSYSYNTTSNNVAYNGHLKLSNVGLLADWHPFAGAFRLTAGAFYNDNKFDLNGQPSGAGTYTFNGNTYTAAQAGTVNANVSFNSISPYIGFGFGDGGTGAGLHFTSDVGVMYQGKPSASITATGAAADPALAADVAAAQTKLQSDLSSFQWYPVLQVGLDYRF